MKLKSQKIFEYASIHFEDNLMFTKNNNKVLFTKKWQVFDFEIEITVTKHGWLVS